MTTLSKALTPEKKAELSKALNYDDKDGLTSKELGKVIGYSHIHPALTTPKFGIEDLEIILRDTGVIKQQPKQAPAANMQAKIIHNSQVAAIDDVLRHSLRLESFVAPDGKTAPGLGDTPTALQIMLSTVSGNAFVNGVIKNNPDLEQVRAQLRGLDLSDGRPEKFQSFMQAAKEGAKQHPEDPYRGAAEALYDKMASVGNLKKLPEEREEIIREITIDIERQSQSGLKNLLEDSKIPLPALPDRKTSMIDLSPEAIKLAGLPTPEEAAKIPSNIEVQVPSVVRGQPPRSSSLSA